MKNLIEALKRYDSLETVITELEAYDRDDSEMTIDELADFLDDEADYANE